MIRPYLSGIINDHKTPKKLRIHSSNEVFDYSTQFGEWKIQLTMSINLFLLRILIRPVICKQKVII